MDLFFHRFLLYIYLPFIFFIINGQIWGQRKLQHQKRRLRRRRPRRRWKKCNPVRKKKRLISNALKIKVKSLLIINLIHYLFLLDIKLRDLYRREIGLIICNLLLAHPFWFSNFIHFAYSGFLLSSKNLLFHFII